jgi:Dynamin GTPase effector domain
MIDMVPKAIMLNLVAHAREDLQRELLENLYRTTALDDLLKESEVSLIKDISNLYSLQSTDGRNVNEWWNRYLKPTRLSLQSRFLGQIRYYAHIHGIRKDWSWSAIIFAFSVISCGMDG